VTTQPLPEFLENFPRPYLNTGRAQGWQSILASLVSVEDYPELDTRATHFTVARAIDALLTEAPTSVAAETVPLLERLAGSLEATSAATVALRAGLHRHAQAQRLIDNQESVTAI
jgi:hypothetical protein